MTRFAALGDSITVGMGDPVPGGGWRGAAAEIPVAGPGPDPEPSSPPPTRLAEVGWMATKGTAWLVRRSRDLVPALLGLALREWLGIGREEPEPESTEPKYTELDGTEPRRVNLNVLSKPSGNLQLHDCVPSAWLKVRNRFSNRNGKDVAAPRQ